MRTFLLKRGNNMFKEELIPNYKYNTELYHHGILGMKWGVRRYQNKDGSLTAKGEKRYAAEVKRNHQKSKKNRVDDEDLRDPNKWVQEDTQNKKDLVDASRNLTNSARELARVTNRPKEKPRLNLSNMSDKELRDKVNRELLERQYNQVFNAPETRKGREKVMNMLETAGAALATVSSSLMIALSIQKLRGNG